MRAFFSDHFTLPLPDHHRFPMAKYRRLRERAVSEGVLEATALQVPLELDDEHLLRVHEAGYVHAVAAGALDRTAQRRIGFPWSPALVTRSRRSAGGTLGACRAAASDGAAINLAGGTHHAFADHGEGFCVFNDAAVAVRALQKAGEIRRALIVDADVHQGNGTAAIFRQDPTVFTFSIHGARNYPFRKERSDLDVALADGTDDVGYLAAFDRALDEAFAFPADLAIYLAGADPWHGDALGRLSLTKAGLAARDRRVVERCRRLGLPLAIVMAGGYAPRVDDIVDIHLETIRLARAGG